ncbi:MAG: caspase family protein [Fischerella sp. CENA71]|nr:caspase family protein [Fischerella sp. CENA71]
MLRQALVVGINNYPGLQNLKTPAGDAELIASLLQKHGGFQVVKRLPVKDNQGLLSVDENPSPQQLVTATTLQEAIAELFNPQGNDVPDTALLYFAGHGLRNDKGIIESFLATSNANPRKDVWGVSLNWLQRILKSSPVKEQIIWLDCCYGGELLNGQFLNFDEANPGERGKGRDRCFIAACGDASVAYGNAEHGILTSLLLKGLDPQRYEVNQWINNYSLTDFIIQQLENDEKLRTFPQRPSYNNSGGEIKLIQGAKQSKVVIFNQLQNNICPYKGLAAFEFNDEDPKYFYGRTALTDELLEKLRRGNFIAVMGASGCGKSSVVKAGLLYQLKLGQRLSGSNEWKILPVIRPGDNPLYSLAEAFTGKDSKKMLIQLLEKELRDNGADRLQDLIAEEIEKYSRVVLVVDQFEEVFTLCQDIKARQQFFDCLLGAVESSNNKLCLVITIRADFVGECAVYPKLAKQIQQDLVTVTPMTTEELTEAIKEPASQVGLGVEETLVIQMIADVQKSPGSLPLLQFTLMELWEKRNINTTENTESNSQLLTLHAYQKMGGVMGALNRHAQQIYNYTNYKSASPSQKRQPQEQELIRRIFLKLLRTGEGVKDTRQPQPKTKLMAIAGEDSQAQAVLSQLIEELIKWRLLVTSEVEISFGESSQYIQIIDLIHEALMSEWEEFAQWREKYRQILRLRDRVDDAFKVWNAHGRKDEDLMMGGLLIKVNIEWLNLEGDLEPLVKDFYKQSNDYKEKTFTKKEIGDKAYPSIAPLYDIYKLNLAVEYAKAVVIVRCNNGMGTGFMIAQNLLMTCNHIIASLDDAEQSTFTFNYQLDITGERCTTHTVQMLPEGKFYTNHELNYTVVTLKDLPNFGKPLILNSQPLKVNEELAIIQHPHAELKKISMLCNVVYTDNNVIQYTRSTSPGSSGSPVFNVNFEVVAIHHSGGMLLEPGTEKRYLRSEGTSMIAVLKDLKINAPDIYACLHSIYS